MKKSRAGKPQPLPDPVLPIDPKTGTAWFLTGTSDANSRDSDLQEFFKGWFIGQMLGIGVPSGNSLAYATREKIVFFLHTVLTTIQSKVDNSRSLYFQNQLYRKFAFDKEGDNLTLYKTLRRLNPSPYMYHLKQDTKTIIGASPEMLVRITNDKVETFPIAGTRKITDDEVKNKQLAEELLHDEKELAEHTMLVDLGRNDIGRVCKYGTVHTEELMEIKRFSHVQHIVTHVVGNLAPENDMFDAFKAVFPAGTVSGAPKVRAMEIIEELESEARGPYAGAVGYFSFNGCGDFAIAIRSIFIDGDKGFVQSGAGIVSDSIAENEFNETEHKAGAMLQALKEASK